DPEELRQSPPPPATEVSFPAYPASSPEPVQWDRQKHPPPDFQTLFLQIRKPSDILPSHLQVLNINFQPQCSIQEMIPLSPDGGSYIPYLSDIIRPLPREAPPSPPAHRMWEFEHRIAEISLDNDLAYRRLSRSPMHSDGVRLTHMARFFDSLENLGQHWDSSLDRYLKVDEFDKPVDESEDGREVYSGRRTSDGKSMPDRFRSETIRRLVESIARVFNCAVAQPRRPPQIKLGMMNLPIRQTAALYRFPTDHRRAREGHLQGPILAVQTRPEFDFASEGGDTRSELDLLRELGALLHLAQERSREGTSEVKPGAGKWWTSAPRWGGGVVNAENFPDHDAKKPNTWATVKCGSGNWDPKTEYLALGKRRDSAYDEVFLVSAIVHHVSIVKLTVHDEYIRLLSSGMLLPDNELEDLPKDWCKPLFQRTGWYNLLDPGERSEAYAAIWGVVSYLMRDS
ncbi:hypothetical protein K470DRAFT_222271, partial [Piedraia hortae CBS 480.64]